jgi:hypothetical protein
MKKPKIVYTAKIPVTISAHGHHEQIRKAINLAVVGMEAVNEYDENMQLVPKKFPAKKLSILKDAHYGIMRSETIMIEFDVTETGQFINFRVAK